MNALKKVEAPIPEDSSPEQSNHLVCNNKDSENPLSVSFSPPINLDPPYIGINGKNTKDFRYFIFPITLLKGALTDIRSRCINIICYSVYAHTLQFQGEIEERIEKAEQYYRIKLGTDNYSLGEDIYQDTLRNTPYVSLKKDLVFEFMEREKTEEDILTFLSFAAIKSILGKSQYCKISKELVLHRMAGFERISTQNSLPALIQNLRTRFKYNKMIDRLQQYWGMKMYSQTMRGMLVTFQPSVSLQDLVLVSEMRKTENFRKAKKKEIDEAIKKVKKLLDNDTGTITAP